MKKIAIICTCVFFAQIVLAGSLVESNLSEEEFLEAQKYVVTVIEPRQAHDLNPRTSTYVSDAQILNGLYEGLFSYDPKTLEPLPAICENYKISRDKKRWTFMIRKNAKFSDGTKITAYDVRRSWLELLSTEGAPYSSMLDIIVGAKEFRTGIGKAEDVEIIENSVDSISIKLNTPVNYLPKLLCHTAFSITHRNPMVSSGAYFITEMKQDQIYLEKNQFYWDAENVKIKLFSFFQSLGDEGNAAFFNTGDTQWITSYDVNTSKVLNKSAIQINAEFGTEYLFFKISDKKPRNSVCSKVWDIKDFRLAVLEAFPWDELRKDFLIQASTFVYPLSGYPDVNGFLYTDSVEAKFMMDDARKKYGIPLDEKIPLRMMVAEGTFSEKYVKLVSDALEPLGIEFLVSYAPFMEYIQNADILDADILSYNWIGDFADPLAFLELFRGDSTLNVSGWKNTEFDNLIDEGAKVDNQKRYELLAQAEQILLDDGIVMPLSHPVSLTVINLYEIGGWYQNAFNLHPLKYIYKKEVLNYLPNVVRY